MITFALACSLTRLSGLSSHLSLLCGGDHYFRAPDRALVDWIETGGISLSREISKLFGLKFILWFNHILSLLKKVINKLLLILLIYRRHIEVSYIFLVVMRNDEPVWSTIGSKAWLMHLWLSVRLLNIQLVLSLRILKVIILVIFTSHFGYLSCLNMIIDLLGFTQKLVSWFLCQIFWLLIKFIRGLP